MALGRLAAALREGEPLLWAALVGVRAARESLEARAAARPAALRTYGRDGAASTLGRAPTGPVRWA